MDTELTRAHAILSELSHMPASLPRRTELLRDLASVATDIGDDVVMAMSMLLRRGIGPIELLSGNRCSTTQIQLPTNTVQMVMLGKPQVCSSCSRILVRNEASIVLVAAENL